MGIAKLASALVIPAAYLLLQRLRNLQLDWLVAAGIFVVSAGVLLYLGKIRANIPQSSSTQSTAATLSTGKAFDATEFFRHSYYSPLQTEIETNVRAAAAQNQPNDREGFRAYPVFLDGVKSGVVNTCSTGLNSFCPPVIVFTQR